MNLYATLESEYTATDTAALRARLAMWHDEMVAHERRVRAGRGELCDDDCPHAEASSLWAEAQEIFGERANELAFLRSVVRGRRPRNGNGRPPQLEDH